MAKFEVGASKLILPDGKELKPGSEVDLDSKALENAGIKSWIKGGLLKQVKSSK